MKIVTFGIARRLGPPGHVLVSEHLHCFDWTGFDKSEQFCTSAYSDYFLSFQSNVLPVYHNNNSSGFGTLSSERCLRTPGPEVQRCQHSIE